MRCNNDLGTGAFIKKKIRSVADDRRMVSTFSSDFDDRGSSDLSISIVEPFPSNLRTHFMARETLGV